MISPATAMQKVFDLVIVGGGLSGVALAHEIQKHIVASSSSTATSFSWILLEAGSSLGGRLANDEAGNRIDLGGAWIWPDFQPNIKRLVKTLNIPTFLQPDDPSSTRIDGGAVEIVNRLAQSLPSERIRLETPVTKCSLVEATDDDGDTCVTSTAAGDKKSIRLETSAGPILAKQVVLAVPPKSVSMHIQFDPPLPKEKEDAMRKSHTWMAGVTKISLVYDSKFWSKELSNGGLPPHIPGPAFQMYDASTKDGQVNAITFFALVPPNSRGKNDDKALGKEVVLQLETLWSLLYGRDDLKENVRNYKSVHVKHWPKQTYISEDTDPEQIHPHPHPVGELSIAEWEGRLHFAGSETDRQSPGVMEGAVGAALRAFQDLDLPERWEIMDSEN